MPPSLFLMLIATVILAAGVTVALFHAAGWPVAAVGLVALVASLLLRVRRRP
ncbi:hypothetical protein LAZ29_11925 [Cereibacter sphaeroides]|uniref:hypothetical protein n=1 Tax=Cereibacter sphaeroides TaxID=1063 RepID=UPI001F162137|nr:hypothetical protein [Cereibacter sphaeroides]MCE6951637.1 hypothetical protein [Cereibacter sphaeroides]